MRRFVFAAAALAVFASPAAAEHLYPHGQFPQGQYAIEGQHGYPPPPDARIVVPRGHDFRYGGERRVPRPGLDRPYGGQGVPYRTPPQGWPDRLI